MSTKSTPTDGPDYDVQIDADELLADLAMIAAEYAADYAEKDRWWRDSLETFEEHTEARYWSLEAMGGRIAVAEAMRKLHAETKYGSTGRFHNADGTVAVREFMAWLSQRADDAHERSHGPYTETRQADEAETAYAKIISLLRDEYDVGWPRFDDLGGVLECDLP
ncbi:hypothetical protein [Natrialba aegyptia]|uniref:hypothetical protein n=1 Tax=Natrialba aegyptia TaxID=129789 RepID=UPI000A3E2783|nr:hypothetical protein [Natrialba aegyptia]